MSTAEQPFLLPLHRLDDLCEALHTLDDLCEEVPLNARLLAIEGSSPQTSFHYRKNSGCSSALKTNYDTPLSYEIRTSQLGITTLTRGRRNSVRLHKNVVTLRVSQRQKRVDGFITSLLHSEDLHLMFYSSS